MLPSTFQVCKYSEILSKSLLNWRHNRVFFYRVFCCFVKITVWWWLTTRQEIFWSPFSTIALWTAITIQTLLLNFADEAFDLYRLAYNLLTKTWLNCFCLATFSSTSLTLLACIFFSLKSQKLVLLKCRKKTKQNKTKHEKQKNSRARGRALKSAVRTLIDKLASKIVRLKAIVRT